MSIPPRPANPFKSSLKQDFDVDGPASPESVLERLSSSFQAASKDAFRMSIISLCATLFYILKVIGLRIDVVMFDQRIFEIPYGIFVFCVIAQLAFVGAAFRYIDARTFDRYVRAVCEKLWPASAESMYLSYIGQSEWLSPALKAIDLSEVPIVLKIVHGVSSAIVGLIIVAVVSSPILTGIYFLYDWREQIVGEWIGLQYWLVMGTTIMSALSAILTIVYYAVDNEDV